MFNKKVFHSGAKVSNAFWTLEKTEMLMKELRLNSILWNGKKCSHVRRVKAKNTERDEGGENRKWMDEKGKKN